MEEAETLATDVAIMGTRMLATETLNSLQEQCGGLYSVHAVREPEASVAEVESMVKGYFGTQVVNYAERHGQVSFNLPHDKSALGQILKIFDTLKGDPVQEEQGGNSDAAAAAGMSSAAREQVGVRVLQDYTINGPALEEVVMNT